MSSALSFKSSSLTSVFWLMLRPMPRPFILIYFPLLHSMKSALFAWVIYQRTYSVTVMLQNFLPDGSFGTFHAHGWTHFQITRKSFHCYFDISELRGIVYSAWVKSGLIVPQILCIAVQCIASRLIAVHKSTFTVIDRSSRPMNIADLWPDFSGNVQVVDRLMFRRCRKSSYESNNPVPRFRGAASPLAPDIITRVPTQCSQSTRS